MDSKEYMKAFKRTLSEGYFPERCDPDYVRHAVDRLAPQFERLKRARNTLFYGGTPNEDMVNPDNRAFALDKNLVHGILGAGGEAFELLELLDGREVTKADVVEEVGDLLFFAALILHSVGSDFEEAMAENIAKLEKRYPDKFSSDRYTGENSL